MSRELPCKERGLVKSPPALFRAPHRDRDNHPVTSRKVGELIVRDPLPPEREQCSDPIPLVVILHRLETRLYVSTIWQAHDESG